MKMEIQLLGIALNRLLFDSKVSLRLPSPPPLWPYGLTPMQTILVEPIQCFGLTTQNIDGTRALPAPYGLMPIYNNNNSSCCCY